MIKLHLYCSYPEEQRFRDKGKGLGSYDACLRLNYQKKTH